MDKEAFSAKIVELREAKELTQADLAAKAGVASRALQRAETPSGNPQLDTILALGAVLGFKLMIITENDARDASQRFKQAYLACEEQIHALLAQVNEANRATEFLKKENQEFKQILGAQKAETEANKDLLRRHVSSTAAKGTKAK